MHSGFNVVNLAYLKDMAEGDAELVAEVVSVFEKQMIDLEGKLRKYIALKNITELVKVVHTIKSSFSVMGIKKMNEDFLYVESRDELDLMIDDFELFNEKLKAILIGAKLDLAKVVVG